MPDNTSFLNKSKQKGAFIVLMAITLAMLIGFIALVIDGARLMISSTKNMQLAEHAAAVAVREYVTYSPQAADAGELHTKRLKRVKQIVASMLNDQLNSLFGNAGAQNVITDEEGNITEGVVLTAGQYFPNLESISDSGLRTSCSANPKLGCWVPYSPGNTQGTGVNSFRAVVTTPSEGLIKTIFFQVIGSQIFQLNDQAFSFLRPRVFMNLVDMSESITEGNFNSYGRYRSKFMFRLADGFSGDGESCISPWEGSTSLTQPDPACRFHPLRDDQIWNAEFYNNSFAVDDNICENINDPKCLNVDRSMCNPPVDTSPNSDWSFNRYDDPMWDWEAPSWLIPGCSPIFWVHAGDVVNHLQTGSECNNRKSCMHQGGFATYAYRFLGDRRIDGEHLFYEPLVQDLIPSNTMPPDPNNLVARQPHFLRFKEDYFPSGNLNFERAIIDPNTGAIVEGDNSVFGEYLVENPYNLNHDEYTKREDGARAPGSWTPKNGQSFGDPDPTGPLGYFQLDSSFNYVGRMNNITYNEYWSRGKGFMLPRIQPFYDGPEPYNSILKGLFFMHQLMAEQRVPGDRFGTFFFDSSLLAINSQVPLTSPIVDLTATFPDGHPQKKLFDLLDAINPADASDSIDRFDVDNSIEQSILKRLNLGIFPDPLAPDTNISHAIAQALLYLSKNGVEGSDIYLNLFTDFIATANCDLNTYTTTYENRLTQCRSINNGNDTNKHNDASFTGSEAQGDEYRSTRRVMGMLNDLIGWPTDKSQSFSNTDVPRQDGLIKYMSKKGITPIFFAFNGTLGGELLYPAPEIDSGCLSRDRVKTAVDANGAPLALTATRSSYGSSTIIDDNMRNNLKQYFREGGNGNFFLYTLGDLSNPVIEAGGKVVQLLKPCPNITKDEAREVFPIPAPPGVFLSGNWPMTAKERLDALCNRAPYSGFRNPPRPVNIWSNSESSNGSFGSYFWSFPEPRWNSEFREWSKWRVLNGWDYVIEMNTQMGGSLLNPIHDFGTLPGWRMDDCGDARINGDSARCCGRDDKCLATGVNDNDLKADFSGSDTWPTPNFCEENPLQCLYNGFGIPAIGKRYTFHMPTDYFTEPFPISLSGVGGLRCDPRPSDPPTFKNGLQTPYGIEGQIREVVEGIVQKPTVVIVSNPLVLTP